MNMIVTIYYYHLHVYTQLGPLSSDKSLWKFLIYFYDNVDKIPFDIQDDYEKLQQMVFFFNFWRLDP